ncbi:protein sidekick-1 [Nematostella vectensis]|uniref:protein sidekick-1 n=1 Tax=Nematostella vectensis TaxID=45351 RepID=UPI002077197B|nr:protein sidekick-1 [Nematostella vectensis]
MIRVSLFNLGGQGNLSEVLTCTTKQDGPSAPPQNVTATVTSPNAIIISFGKIPSQDENGIVQYYRICVYEKELGITFMQCIQVNNTAKGTRRRREVAFDMYSKALTGLKPHTEYVIQVHGHTIKDGVYSDPITITTDEDVPTLPPENVMVFNTSTTSLKLQWGEIPSGHLNGVLRAFNITYWPTNDPNTITNISITPEQALGTATVTQEHNITTSSETPTTRPSSETPTSTSSETPTKTSSETPTTRPFSETRTTTSSETPTETSSETPTTTSSETPTKTSSETPTTTSSETPTTTSSETPTTTSSETPTTRPFSETPTTTSSETPTKTSSETPTTTSSETPTKTSSETPTTTSSETPTTTSSETPTTTFSETPTKTSSETPTKTSSETPTKTSSETPTTTSSETPTTTSNETPTKTSKKTPATRPSSETPTTRPSSETPTTKPPEISFGRRRRSVATPTYSWELTGLKIWTDYTVRINGFTIGEGPRSPEMNASTDMGVPSSPPDDVTYDVLSPSSIIVRWKPVPVHHRNGIIQGYRLRYQTEMRIIIVNLTADQYSAILTDLDRVANYTIFMSAFTRSGEGNSSYDFIASDSFGPKTSPINLTAENWVTPSTVPVYWMPLDEPEINEKLMGYRISWRPVSLGDVEVRNAPWENATVRKDSPTKYIIRGLLNYARYEINVAGFTRGGDGPSDSDHGETCRCHKRIAANYRVFPPYVIATVGDASVNMSGMIPEILDNLTVSCCRTCFQHGKSYVDFFTNGHGDPSYQLNSNDVRDLIDSRNELSFPVYGWKDQNFFDGEYPFIPLVESPGFAFLVKSPEMGSVLRRILISIMDMWPIVAVTVLMALLAGVMIWVLDTTANPEHFPSSVASGLWNGWWWAFITMTTLGYGDRVPKTNKAKVFAIVWILVGLVIFGILNGSLTSAFTSIVFTSTTGLYNTKVAALSNTPEYHFGVRMQAMVNTDRNYSRFTDVVQALTSSSVHGILIDAYEAGYKRIDLAGTGIRIQRVYDRLSTYGVVLSGPSVRLHQCSRNYMTAHKAEMFAHIEKFVLVVEAEDFNELVELSTGLFDKESEVFKQVMMYTLALIAVLTSFALLWEVYRLGKKRKFSDFDAHQAKRKEMEVEIRDFVNAFCTELTVSLSAMKQQHLREQLALVRNQEKSVVTYNNMESFT